MAKTYTTVEDYIEQNITPGLGDMEVTDEQALGIAQRMTEWNDEGQLVECENVDFWYAVADVLGDK